MSNYHADVFYSRHVIVDYIGCTLFTGVSNDGGLH